MRLARLAAGLLMLPVLGTAPAGLAQTPNPKATTTKPPAQAFDARDPSSMVALLADLGAKGEVTRNEADAVYLRVTTPAYGFNIQFAGCDIQHRACKALVFSAPATRGTATLSQINRFNQTAIACRGYQDQAGGMNAMYDALVFARDSGDELTAHLGAWQGCLAAFGEFLDDPNRYLASAP